MPRRQTYRKNTPHPNTVTMSSQTITNGDNSSQTIDVRDSQSICMTATAMVFHPSFLYTPGSRLQPGCITLFLHSAMLTHHSFSISPPIPSFPTPSRPSSQTLTARNPSTSPTPATRNSLHLSFPTPSVPMAMSLHTSPKPTLSAPTPSPKSTTPFPS